MVNILPLVKKISTISSPTHLGQFILTLALRIDFLFRRPDFALFKMDLSKKMSSLSDPLNIHDWVERYFKLMPHGGAPSANHENNSLPPPHPFRSAELTTKPSSTRGEGN
jgi:hypothetical protein